VKIWIIAKRLKAEPSRLIPRRPAANLELWNRCLCFFNKCDGDRVTSLPVFFAPPHHQVLQQCMLRRSVCITTYGLIVTQWQALGETADGREFVWDYIILDEGHRIKNPTKTTKRLHSVPSRNRVILTGKFFRFPLFFFSQKIAPLKLLRFGERWTQ